MDESIQIQINALLKFENTRFVILVIVLAILFPITIFVVPIMTFFPNKANNLIKKLLYSKVR